MSSRVATTRMSVDDTRSFVGSLSSVCLGKVDDVIREGLQGNWPKHWVDDMHERDGGNDKFGLRPQCGIDILEGEMQSLIFRDGIAVAKDDVTGKELVPKLVQEARAEEMKYFRSSEYIKWCRGRIRNPPWVR